MRAKQKKSDRKTDMQKYRQSDKHLTQKDKQTKKLKESLQYNKTTIFK